LAVARPDLSFAWHLFVLQGQKTRRVSCARGLASGAKTLDMDALGLVREAEHTGRRSPCRQEQEEEKQQACMRCAPRGASGAGPRRRSHAADDPGRTGIPGVRRGPGCSRPAAGPEHWRRQAVPPLVAAAAPLTADQTTTDRGRRLPGPPLAGGGNGRGGEPDAARWRQSVKGRCEVLRETPRGCSLSSH
jgi:hypothetical protein